jgi:hypothetical protein
VIVLALVCTDAHDVLCVCTGALLLSAACAQTFVPAISVFTPLLLVLMCVSHIYLSLVSLSFQFFSAPTFSRLSVAHPAKSCFSCIVLPVRVRVRGRVCG